MTLNGRLEVTSWQEDEVEALDEAAGRTTRAAIGYRLSGGIDGTALSQVIMQYQADGTASVVGLLAITGAVDGRSGTLLLETVGGYDGTTATGALRPVLGTGVFAGASGSGRTAATSTEAEYSLDVGV